jgi:hypothetical protein
LRGVEGGQNGIDGSRADCLPALDELDELVDDRAGLPDAALLSLESKAVAAEKEGDAEAIAEGVEDAVVDRGELGRDLVGNRENFLQRTECSEAGGADRPRGHRMPPSAIQRIGIERAGGARTVSKSCAD